jgi:hypothetical protein
MVGPDVEYPQSSGRDYWRDGAYAPALSDSTSRRAKGSVLLIDSQRFTRERLMLLLASEMPHFEIIPATALEAIPPDQMARADIIVINAVPEATVVRICAAMSSKPVLWLCEDVDGVPGQYDDFDIFPARCSGALLAAALQLIAAGGRFLAPRKADSQSAQHRHARGPQCHAPSVTA